MEIVGTGLVLLLKGFLFDGGLQGDWGWIDEAILAWFVWNAGVWIIRRVERKGGIEVTTPPALRATSQWQAGDGLPYKKGRRGGEEVKRDE